MIGTGLPLVCMNDGLAKPRFVNTLAPFDVALPLFVFLATIIPITARAP